MIDGTPDDRRQHLRFPLGLPVVIHLEGRDQSLTVEIVDIAMRGVRCRAAAEVLPMDQQVSFGFVTSGHKTCVAVGRVVRVADGGEFVLSLERSNAAFDNFIGSLAA